MPADPVPSPAEPTVHVAPGFPVVGVVGAGQLARMMAPPAVELGVGLRVLAESAQASAAQVIPDAPVGDHRDEAAVRAFAAGADVLTFDHEHVPQPILQALEADGVAVRPPAAALAHAQDKLVMRRRLTDLGVPCPCWRQVATLDELEAFATEVGDVVLKTPTGGYDGKGVLVLPADGPRDEAQRWLAARPDGLLAEEKVPFTRELAVLVARSPSGQAAAWPVVESIQVDGICHEVIAPAPGLDDGTAALATEIGLKLAGELGVVGVLAVELFQTRSPDGTTGVLVNELAMRPHNSGHWTIDGSLTSQFEQHLRAVLDLPLGDPRPRARWAVMVNVLGGDYPDLYRSYLHVMARDPGVKVHLYGKEVRPGRKVGHVTVTGRDLDDVRARARHAAAFITGEIDE
ncbi:5-(carboxyamino)imidazole ribonucleotide synthase [Spongisporangium articulatum]|uniref:N5-carboxyaminoimidazole ribonucleotide synthase n=1 Tax=Spongisporangium articulatum TaxID=3362603 RepID=A0ABW8APL3_9ACTN